MATYCDLCGEKSVVYYTTLSVTQALRIATGETIKGVAALRCDGMTLFYIMPYMLVFYASYLLT
jgi:hypothetical protein